MHTKSIVVGAFGVAAPRSTGATLEKMSSRRTAVISRRMAASYTHAG